MSSDTHPYPPCAGICTDHIFAVTYPTPQMYYRELSSEMRDMIAHKTIDIH